MEIRTYSPVDAGDPRLHGVEDAAAEIVAEAPDRRELRREAFDDGDGGVLVEVVHDEDLVRDRDRGRHRAQDRLDGLSFLEDRHHDREERRRVRRHASRIPVG